MNGLHFFFGFGALLSPIIVAQAILISGDITWAYWALALLILPVVVWLLSLPSPTAHTVSENAPAGPVDRVMVLLIASFFFLYVGAEVSFSGWIFTYSLISNLCSQASAAYLTSAFWGAFTLGRLLSIPVAARISPRAILICSLIACLVNLSMILLWSKAIWIGTLGFGLSMGSIFPTTLSFAERRLLITGRVTSWFFVGGSSGAMFLPWLVGQLCESFGPHSVMLTIIIDLMAAVGILTLLIFHSIRPVLNKTDRIGSF